MPLATGFDAARSVGDRSITSNGWERSAADGPAFGPGGCRARADFPAQTQVVAWVRERAAREWALVHFLVSAGLKVENSTVNFCYSFLVFRGILKMFLFSIQFAPTCNFV